MPESTLRFDSPRATSRFAARLAPRLRAGHVLLLEGGLGAGKTHFARSLIQARLQRPEDVPSPTYTLVQTYDAGDVEIWHADLHRLGGADEAVDLGLDDAFETAVCLVEWPDRLPGAAREGALTLRFRMTPRRGERVVTAAWEHPRWTPVLAG